MSWLGMAQSLIERYGQQVTIKRIEEGGFDPVTGTTGEETFEVPVMAGPPHNYLTATLDGGVVKRGDTLVDVAGDLDMTSTGASAPSYPTPSDKVLLNSTLWNVVNVGRVYAEGEVITYRLLLRK